MATAIYHLSLFLQRPLLSLIENKQFDIIVWYSISHFF